MTETLAPSIETRKLIICRGIPGSGKTTWAKEWAKEYPENRIRINWDDIRNMLGEYWVTSREKLVTAISNTTLAYAMEKGYNICMDNMNLNPKTCEELKTKVKDFNENFTYNWIYEIEYKDFFIPIEECIRRDALRSNPIGESIIKSTYKKYKNIITFTEISNTLEKQLPYIDNIPDAIIVDIDGTLCINGSNRPWYGPGAAEGMLKDLPIKGTCNVIKNMYSKCRIIILTGREATEEIKKATKQWLSTQDIQYSEIYFRQKGNYDSAHVYKEKIYEECIKDKYNILFVLEDNNKCVKMFRNKGLIVLQPNEGNY